MSKASYGVRNLLRGFAVKGHGDRDDRNRAIFRDADAPTKKLDYDLISRDRLGVKLHSLW